MDKLQSEREIAIQLIASEITKLKLEQQELGITLNSKPTLRSYGALIRRRIDTLHSAWLILCDIQDFG